MRLALSILIILISSIISPLKIEAYGSSKFARIEKSTNLYRTTSNNNQIENIYCIAEQTYFVEIIGDYYDFFRVIYNGQNGYIKKNDVKEIYNQPSTPYPNNIKLVIENNCNLRSSPTTKSSNNNIICTLHSNEDNIQFIGRTIGEEAIDFGGNTWYYVNYNGNYGYVYNKYIKSITPIYPNIEEVKYQINKIEKIDNPITHTPSLIIIIVLMIPFILILLILSIPYKNKKRETQSKQNKIIEKY